MDPDSDTLDTSATHIGSNMQSQINQVLQRCKEVFKEAQARYGVDLSATEIRFDLRGRAAGMAGMRFGHTVLRFNRDMLGREAFDHLLNNTVPHEIAHLVCFVKPSLGRNHDAGWARVCRALGGNGETCHSEKVVLGKGYTYEYVSTRGHVVRLGQRHHDYLLSGRSLELRRGLGTITNSSPCKIVGYAGKTLDVPRVIRPAAQESCTEISPEPLHVNASPSAHVSAAPAPAPAARPTAAPTAGALVPGSKAARSREIMLRGYRDGWNYEQIITAMIAANGYDRQLARGTFKANAARVGIPESFYK
jgi:SprT protein